MEAVKTMQKVNGVNGVSNGVSNGISNGINGVHKITYHGDFQGESCYESASKTAEFLKSKTKHRPTIGIICGSGLGGLADQIEDADTFDFKEVPNFPVSTVTGHKGRLIFGQLGGKCVMCMQGRAHGYEGYSQPKITFPVRVMKLLGVESMIVTNAAGGLNPAYKVGDVMIMKDHINLPGLCGVNPLVGTNDDRFGPRFPAMSAAYDKGLRDLAKDVAEELKFDFIREGVYVIQVGPCFETVAECRMLRSMGADVTGMSTVPEATVAVHCGIRVFGMSLVTNECVVEFDAERQANHEEVLETGRMRSKDMQRLVHAMLARM